MKRWCCLGVALLVLAGGLFSFSPEAAAAEKKKIVFVAGRPSHNYGAHEHNAGCALLARCLQEGMPDYEIAIHRGGWPEDASIFDGADAVVVYSDGGDRHPVIPSLAYVDGLAEKRVGIVCIHYAVEVPKGDPGQHFLKWIGGYFETHWSVNPHWTANFEKLPDHPITRGVQPFAIEDEWYYHMRFRDEMQGVTPILTAIPPESTLNRPDGPHSNNPHVRAEKGKPQHVAWAAERPNGGRGFGFTGGHFHWNWGDEDFRRLVLNAIVWTAQGEVPAGGVGDKSVSLRDLEANQDYPPPADFDREDVRKRLKLPADNQGDKKGAEKKEPSGEQGAAARAKPIFRSPLVTPATPGHAVTIDVDIRGAKQLFLVVRDGGDNFSCDWADWAEPTLIGPSGSKQLTELSWRSASADWGQPRINANAGGGPLRIAGKALEFGIGTHANSVIAFDLPEGLTRFQARAGLDNGGTDQEGCGAAASAQFLVYTSDPDIQRPGGDSRDPADAVAALDVAEGLEAKLFASEPTLLSLTNLDIDHRGRIWVCEVVNYRKHNGQRPEGDRILILEDEDGDGRADSTKVFYQGRDIDSAMGLCVLGNKVIVSASPNVFVFTDEDGDDRPDRKEVFFSNTGQPQHDHSAHSFLFGPDGKLYWNFGNTGQRVCDANGQPVVDLAGNQVIDNGKPYWGGMPFRCDLDGGNFEVLAHNFRNNYEVTVDSFGTLWQSDNDDDGNRGVRINYVMEFGNYGYRDEITGAGWQTPRTDMEDEIPLRHWHLNDPGVVPNLLQTGAGSPTGITVYEGRLLPRVFWDQVLHCDAGPNIVRAYPVTKNGAGYQAETVNLLHGARDIWFRPADVCVAPDGSVFVTDWYDPGVGGHNMGDLERGRLFRIAPPGHGYRVPKLDLTTVDGAITALKNPNLSARYLGFTALQKMGQQAVPALMQMAQHDENPRMRARAIWLLGKISDNPGLIVKQALADREADLRIVGIRLARQSGMDVVALCGDLLNRESDRQVLRECAIALRGNSTNQAAEVWARLAMKHDGEDRWFLEALGIAASGQWDRCLEAWLSQVGDGWQNTAAGRDIVWRSRAPQTPRLLARLIDQGSGASGPLPRYFRAFDFQAGDEKVAALRQLAFATRQRSEDDRRLIAAEALARLTPHDLRPADVEALTRSVAEMPRDQQFVQIVQQFQLLQFVSALREIALEHSEDGLGVEAVRALLQMDRPLVKTTLSDADADTALKFARILGLAADGRAAALLLDVARDDARPLEVRRRAAWATGQTVNGAKLLLEMAEKNELPEILLQAAAGALHASASADIRRDAARLFPLPAAKDDRPLPSLEELLKMRGDVGRGRVLYTKDALCANCHQVKGEGKEVGPALTEIGSKLSRQALIESILFPSAGISHNYETYALQTDGGNTVTGILVSKTDQEIVLKTQEAIALRFPLADVADLQKIPVSLMPADLQKQMTAQDLVDVVEYLTTLKSP